MDLSRFVNLREFIVGDKSFEGVEEVDLIGLNRLERVVIGKHSFLAKIKQDKNESDNSHFCVKRCERLKELKIGCLSFLSYKRCEIENDDSLEVIEIGDEKDILNSSFLYSSLAVKSEYNKVK